MTDMTIDPEKLDKMIAEGEALGAQAIGVSADQFRDLVSQLGFNVTHPVLTFALPPVGMLCGVCARWLTFDQFGRALDIALARADGRFDRDQDFLVTSMVKPVIAKDHKPDCDDIELHAMALSGAILMQLSATVNALVSVHREWNSLEKRQILDDVRQLVMFLAKGTFSTIEQLRQN